MSTISQRLSGGLLTAALAVGALSAAPAQPAPKEEPKKEQPRQAQPARPLPPDGQVPEILPPNFDDLFKGLQLDPKELQQLREEMMRAEKEFAEAMKQLRQMRGGAGGGLFVPLNPNRAPGLRDGRLGARVEKPNATLADQLDLPKDQGLVVDLVVEGSAAAKAGLKAHDILLELNGKPVPSDVQQFVKELKGIKPDTPVDAVVLRKGKKETIKGLSLPEAKAEPNPVRPGLRLPLPVPPGAFPNPPAGGLPGAGGAAITVERTNDQVKATEKEGDLEIRVSGKVADGKTTVSEIAVNDNGKTTTYDSLDKVPEQYRAKAKRLAEMAGGKGAARPRVID